MEPKRVSFLRLAQKKKIRYTIGTVNYKDYFGPYATEQNKFLKGYFKGKVKESRKVAPSVAPKMWLEMERFITGGKRMRGGLVKLGYESLGGKKLKDLLPVSVAIEITHGALLIHDDVIDQDSVRHGQDTVHIAYKKYHKKHYKKGDSQQYGESMAISLGISAYYEAMRLIADADFPAERKENALKVLSIFATNTGIGEALDVDLGYRNTVSERDVLAVYKLKTAWYTIIGPLGLGAALTGASLGKVKIFEKYGLPLGIAFQIQDDILGTYGDEKKTGKPTASDIKEGKNTILYTQAIKRATPAQKKRLAKFWGRKDLKKQEIQEVRAIIANSGSLAYAQKLARKFVNEAKLAVPQLTRDKRLQEVYVSLADFIVEREK